MYQSFLREIDEYSDKSFATTPVLFHETFVNISLSVTPLEVYILSLSMICKPSEDANRV